MEESHCVKCPECGEEFDNRDAVIAHMQEVHNIDLCEEFSCKKCHEVFNGKKPLANHKCTEHNKFQENKKECWLFRQGRCHWGERCKFIHTLQQGPGEVQGGERRREYTEACRRGRGCGYMAAGICSFFHPGVGVQKPREAGQGGRWGQQGHGGRGQGGQGAQDFSMRRQFQENY